MKQTAELIDTVGMNGGNAFDVEKSSLVAVVIMELSELYTLKDKEPELFQYDEKSTIYERLNITFTYFISILFPTF